MLSFLSVSINLVVVMVRIFVLVMVRILVLVIVRILVMIIGVC